MKSSEIKVKIAPTYKSEKKPTKNAVGGAGRLAPGMAKGPVRAVSDPMVTVRPLTSQGGWVGQ